MQAGRRIAIAFNSTDEMPHNVVVLPRGRGRRGGGPADIVDAFRRPGRPRESNQDVTVRRDIDPLEHRLPRWDARRNDAAALPCEPFQIVQRLLPFLALDGPPLERLLDHADGITGERVVVDAVVVRDTGPEGRN